MAIGYFLCVDDKTSCGGSILEGYEGWMSNGKPRARAGDAVTCGLDGKVYRIDGGVPFQILGSVRNVFQRRLGKAKTGEEAELTGCQ